MSNKFSPEPAACPAPVRVALTEMTECGGCAAKMDPQKLDQLLALLHPPQDPRLLVGLAPKDDAAVYYLTPEMALVQTVDFFPPIVNDPYLYGQIAAANAMSDIYAMGGEVILGTNLVAAPFNFPIEVLARILQGALDKMAEGQATIAGGHSIFDREPKYGLCVTGLVHPQKILTKGGARATDYLYLTKPLGNGLVLSAAKHSAAYRADYQAAIQSMLRLNRQALELLKQLGLAAIHACTDITGFGLLGHASEMAVASPGVDFVIDPAKLPFLPGAHQYAKEGWLPGSVERNQTFLQAEARPKVTFLNPVEPEIEALLFGPETSGGLFLAVAEAQTVRLEHLFEQAGQPLWQVGYTQSGSGLILVA